MQIYIPKNDKHGSVFVTDSLLMFLILTIIKRISKCKHSQKPTISSQEYYWNSTEKDEHHYGLYT